MLLDVLQALVERGNTVIVIEHNLDVIKCADWVVDLGPEGGDERRARGGRGNARGGGATRGSHTGEALREVLADCDRRTARGRLRTRRMLTRRMTDSDADPNRHAQPRARHATRARTMRAVVKAAAGAGRRDPRGPGPDLRPGRAAAAVLRAGVCGTDLHIYTWDRWSQGRLRPPVTLGHEFVGEVVELGAGVDRVRDRRARLVREPHRLPATASRAAPATATSARTRGSSAST